MDQKNHILNIAKKRFERFGYKKTTMDEISSDAKVSKKTVYELFKDKEDLFITLFSREALEAREYIFSMITDIDDPRDKLVKLAEVIKNYFDEYNFMVKVIKDNDDLYTPYLQKGFLMQIEEETINIISDIIDEGIRKKLFQNLDTKTVGYAVFKMFQAFTYARTSTIKGDTNSRAKQVQSLMDFILKGLSL